MIVIAVIFAFNKSWTPALVSGGLAALAALCTGYYYYKYEFELTQGAANAALSLAGPLANGFVIPDVQQFVPQQFAPQQFAPQQQQFAPQQQQFAPQQQQFVPQMPMPTYNPVAGGGVFDDLKAHAAQAAQQAKVAASQAQANLSRQATALADQAKQAAAQAHTEFSNQAAILGNQAAQAGSEIYANVSNQAQALGQNLAQVAAANLQAGANALQTQ